MNRLTSRLKVGLKALIVFGVVLSSTRALALPGQTIEEAKAWIRENTTLQPASGETLLVRKSDTPSRRFTFAATLAPPGRATGGQGEGKIRSERVTLFDTVNGVSQERLEHSLRVIYGDDIYQDYQQAQVVYQYPLPQQSAEATNRATPLRHLVQGEIRQGNRFAYWLETVQTGNGRAYSGQFSVFLIDDVGKLEAELQNR